MLIMENFAYTRKWLGELLLVRAPEVRVPEWQSLDVADKPMGITRELQNAIIQVPIPESREDAIIEVEPNLPWAEEHFMERVSGVPHNPPPSHINWPFAQSSNGEHIKAEKFSHTYPERMWPKYAGLNDEQARSALPIRGIRFDYGDLMDVVNLLHRSPSTRQAYLPIWFPEDTGAVHGERVPCSLGYHFLVREGKIHVTYFIRSCDFLRHFQDDVYLAMRLGQWVRDEVARIWAKEDFPSDEKRAEWDMGTLTMHMISLHIFGGDVPRMEKEYGVQENSE